MWNNAFNFEFSFITACKHGLKKASALQRLQFSFLVPLVKRDGNSVRSGIFYLYLTNSLSESFIPSLVLGLGEGRS